MRQKQTSVYRKASRNLLYLSVLVVSAGLSADEVRAADGNKVKSENRYVSATQQSVRDLGELQVALEKYRKAKGGYPPTGGGWDGVVSCWGKSTRDWIPGLAPEFINKVPSDPRKSSDCNYQYLYRSDGHNYKLVVTKPEGLAAIKKQYPELADPTPHRSELAYGIWSEGARMW